MELTQVGTEEVATQRPSLGLRGIPKFHAMGNTSESRSPITVEQERRMLENDLLLCEASLAKFSVKDERLRLAARHPLLFGRIYFPEWMSRVTPEFHWDITHGYVHFPFFAVAAPVGGAKTTVLTKMSNLWSIFFEEWVRETLVVSSAADLASTWLDDMSSRMRANDALVYDFGEFFGSHWGSSTLEFVFQRNGVTKYIRALGRGGALRGRRPDRIILDDPEDEESVKSEKQRRDYKDWFLGALIGRLDTTQKKMTYIGTCITPETYLTELVNHPLAGWQCRSYAMLNDETGKSLWEDKWPASHLQERRKMIGEAKFQAEYQNNPVNNWHQLVFDASKVEMRKEPYIVQPQDRVTVTCDPAFTVGGDHWGVSVVAVDRQGFWHVLVAVKEDTGTEGWMTCLKDMKTLYPRLVTLGIEAGGGHGPIEYTMDDFVRQNSLAYDVHYLKHPASLGAKWNRIATMTNLINAGRMDVGPACHPLMEEIRGYHAGVEKQEDHLLDSLTMHQEVQTAVLPSLPHQPTPDEVRHDRMNRLRSWIKSAKAPEVPVGRWERYA